MKGSKLLLEGGLGIQPLLDKPARWTWAWSHLLRALSCLSQGQHSSAQQQHNSDKKPEPWYDCLFQSGFPPETLCFPHSRGRFKNRTASDLCRVNILFSWLAWLNSMCCMVSKDHSQLQAAQFLEAEKRHISSLEMSHTVNLSSIS